MTTLRDAAQAALEALESSRVFVTSREKIKHPEGTEWYDERITALRAALAQEQAEPLTGLDLFLDPQDGLKPKRYKLKAALAQERAKPVVGWMDPESGDVVSAAQRVVWAQDFGVAGQRKAGRFTIPLRACLASEQADPCPNCASLEAQNTELDRKLAEMEQAEPAQAPVTWVASEDGCVIYDDISMDDVVLRVSGDFETDEQRIRCAKRIADALNAAPPRRTMVPLTAQQLDGVIERHVGGSEITDDVYASMEQFARAIEKASWEKNHG